MQSSKIFLVGKDESLTPMDETNYDAEATLQKLLATYPGLLPGDQIDPESPRRWLLVSQEMGVPGDTGETARWSLDHLFLDQDGIPTFVECKRAQDTRSRREVVAQMLDYAANGVEYWSIDQIRQAAAKTAEQQGKDLEEELGKLLGDGSEEFEDYWRQVAANLQERRIRLLFVMDTIPKELRRLVEFLNGEMTHVEVLAVEIKQFQSAAGEGPKALVPRVIGFTEAARSIKQTGSARRPLTWDEFIGGCDAKAADLFQEIVERARKKGDDLYLGKQGLSIRPQVQDHHATFLYCTPPGRLSFYFDPAWRSLLFPEELLALRKRLLEFDVLEETRQWTLAASVTEDNEARLRDLCDWVFAEIDRMTSKWNSEWQRGD